MQKLCTLDASADRDESNHSALGLGTADASYKEPGMKTSRWFLLCFMADALWGQDQTPNSQTSGTSKDRLFFALPNFLTVENAGDVPPLTTAQKFQVTARSSFDYVELAWYGALAGIDQAENSQPSYGQGAAGYAKRYGERFADGTIENFMTGAVFASILHQDPRFYQSSAGGFWHRAAYAASRIVVTRSDSGHSQFNYSEIFGSATAATISTFTYHPHDERNLPNLVDVWATEIAFDTLSNELKEFWPDIRRKLRPARSSQAQ
jgi:hypothetical protein